MCLTCLEPLYKSKQHTCVSKSRRAAAKNLQQNVRSQILESCAANILSTKKSPGIDVELDLGWKKSMTVSIPSPGRKPSQRKKQTVSLATIQRAKLVSGVSQNQMMKIVREVSQDVKMETQIRKKLELANDLFKNCFASSIEETQDGSKVPVVFCTDLPKLIDIILSNRSASVRDTLLRISIDEGRGFLKVTGSLIYKTEEQDGQIFKSTGVKRVFILAIAAVKEDYSTVAMLLSKLDWNSLPPGLPYFFAQDLKMCNIVLGLGNHKSTFPCLFCLWKAGE